MLRFSLILFLYIILAGAVSAADDAGLKTSPLAVAYGSHPDIQSPRLSPDGTKISFLQSHPDGFEFLRVLDFNTKQVSGMIAAGQKDKVDLKWCRWASAERLLCGISRIEQMRGPMMPGGGSGGYMAQNQVLGVNADGAELKVIATGNPFLGAQDIILDWLPDDKQHVLVLESTMEGSGLNELDIYTGKTKSRERKEEGVRGWLTDGRGVPRLYQRSTRESNTWFGRAAGPDAEWQTLHKTNLRGGAPDRFMPLGFGADLEELLYLDSNNDRAGLFAMKLGQEAATRLVFGHPLSDAGQPIRMGKHNRIVGIAYSLEREHQHLFDPKVKDVHERLQLLYPDTQIAVIDEDWNGRYYLVHLDGGNEIGSYHLFDSEQNLLVKIGTAWSRLKEHPPATVKVVNYTANDGARIEGYLSLPPGGAANGLPTVILPYDNASNRRTQGHDFLVQFLNASGYAVLQANYRGSLNLGAWAGAGAFRDWEQAIADVGAGTQYLIEQKIADPARIGIAGWGFGGYAALMSGITDPGRYKCIVSINGVGNPEKLGGMGGRGFMGAGGSSDIPNGENGSPEKRAGEIRASVLLVQAAKDYTVPYAQFEDLRAALERGNAKVESAEYAEAEHTLWPERYRIDLLTRMGKFLDANL